MRRGIVPVDSTAEHSDGQTSGFERAAVRLAVDSTRETAHDDESCRCELAAEHPGDLRAVGRARPRAHYRHGRFREHVVLRFAA